MSKLDELLKETPGTGQGCRICGERNRALIQIRISTLGEDQKPLSVRNGGKHRSAAASFCDEHAFHAWIKLTRAWDEIRKNEA